MQFINQSARNKCAVCGKEIIVKSVRGPQSIGYCSRVCASMKRYEKRYTGARSEKYSNPVDVEKKRNE